MDKKFTEQAEAAFEAAKKEWDSSDHTGDEQRFFFYGGSDFGVQLSRSIYHEAYNDEAA